MNKKQKRARFLMLSMTALEQLTPREISLMSDNLGEALLKSTKPIILDDDLIIQSEEIFCTLLDWAGQNRALAAVSRALQGIAKDYRKDASSFIEKDEKMLLSDAQLLESICALVNIYTKACGKK